MKPIVSVSLSIGALALLTLGGCSTVSDYLPDRKVEYKKSRSIETLEVPPDLSVSLDDEMSVPDATPSGGAAVYSEYNREREQQAGIPNRGQMNILPTQDNIQIQRDGHRMWLVINAPAEQIWPKIREFWLESGFLLKKDDSRIGILETEWAENRADIPEDIIRRTVGKVLDFAWSASTRDKYRVRLERLGADRSEVYITHRGVEQVAKGEEYFIWQARPRDPELEAEMLKRMMVYLGISEERARSHLARGAGDQSAADAIGTELRDGQLEVREDFARTWQYVGLALDQAGFSLEDRNRSEGIYYIRYVPEELKDTGKDEGWFSSWFSSDKPQESKEYLLLLDDSGSLTRIRVLNADETPADPRVTENILKLIQERLK